MKLGEGNFMPLFKNALVLGTEGNQARIKIKVHENCQDCGMCGSPEVTLQATNSVAAQAGELVDVETKPHQEIKIILIELLLPILSLVIGLFAGYRLAAVFKLGAALSMLICTAPLFFLTSTCALWYDRRHRGDLGPSIKATRP